MPDRFRGRRIPAIFYAYPGESMTAVGMIAGGAVLVLPPYPMANYGGGWDLFIPFMGAYTMLAGLLTFIGLAAWRKTWQSGLEQLGLWLTTGAMTAYLVVLFIVSSPSASTLPGIALACIGASSVLRAGAIRILSKQKLEELTATNALREEVRKHGPGSPGPTENPGPTPPRR